MDDSENKIQLFRRHLLIPAEDCGLCRFQIAVGSEREESHSFLRDIYEEQGFWKKDDAPEDKLFYHRLPGTTCFTARVDGILTGTISIFGDGKEGLPSDGIFSIEMQALRKEGRSFVEVGALVTRGRQPYVLHNLYKLILNFSMHHLQADDLLLSVHPRHKTFYQALFCMKEVGGSRPHPSVNGSPAVLLRMDLHTAAGEMERAFPRNPLDRDMYRFYILERPSSFPKEIYEKAREGEGYNV